MYSYEIVDNCKHKQKHKFNFHKDSEQYKELKQLDESPYCLKLVVDYINGMTLRQYMASNKLNDNQIYSIILQICKIILILHKKGYYHNDLNPNNIMVVETKTKYFDILDEKIPYYGIQLIAIDYDKSP
jgi:serine/threonine protein kinase